MLGDCLAHCEACLVGASVSEISQSQAETCKLQACCWLEADGIAPVPLTKQLGTRPGARLFTQPMGLAWSSQSDHSSQSHADGHPLPHTIGPPTAVQCLRNNTEAPGDAISRLA